MEHEQCERVSTQPDGARGECPSRIRRVRSEGSGGNGDWLHTGVIFQMSEYIKDNGKPGFSL